MINKKSKILVTGHHGLVGSNVVNLFKSNGYERIITVEKTECDFTNQDDVNCFFYNNKIDCVIMCAARVGGIQFNIDNPARMIYENTMINMNTFEASRQNNIKDLVFLGSSCCYPKDVWLPILEQDLFCGRFEETNEMYAISKSTGIRTVQSYNKQYGFNWKALQPCNLYGPNDNFSLKNGHFIPSVLRKLHEAKINNKSEVTLWGTGTVVREVLHVFDLVKAIETILTCRTEYDFLNVGFGIDYEIKWYCEIIKDIIGYNGTIIWDKTKPSGVYRKLIDSSKIRDLGWTPTIEFEKGIETTYNWFLKTNEEMHSYRLNPRINGY